MGEIFLYRLCCMTNLLYGYFQHSTVHKILTGNTGLCTLPKTWITIKQKEQSKLKIQKTRQSHEIRRHNWQDNMKLYENQRWNQMFRTGKHFLFCTRHPSWCPLCHIKEWNVLMTTISWPTDVISRGGLTETR